MAGWKVRPASNKLPKRVAGAATRMFTALRLFGLDAQAKISLYPPDDPSGYTRTGDLGQAWTTDGPKLKGADLVVRVGNKKKYAARVLGSDQQERFKKRGWPNIVDTTEEVWARHRPLVIQSIQG